MRSVSPSPARLTQPANWTGSKLGQEVFPQQGPAGAAQRHCVPPSGAGGAAAPGGVGGKIFAIDAINLLEGGLDQLCDRTIAVTAPLELRVRRIMARDNITEQYARLRISAQKPDEYYRGKCDCELNNAADTAAAFEMEARVFPAADRHHQGGKSTWKAKEFKALKGAAALLPPQRLRPDGRGGARRHGIVLHGLQGISGH